jgi:hypothetical protein
VLAAAVGEGLRWNLLLLLLLLQMLGVAAQEPPERPTPLPSQEKSATSSAQMGLLPSFVRFRRPSLRSSCLCRVACGFLWLVSQPNQMIVRCPILFAVCMQCAPRLPAQATVRDDAQRADKKLTPSMDVVTSWCYDAEANHDQL